MAQWLLLFQSIQVQLPAPMLSGLQPSLTARQPDTYTRVWHTQGLKYTHK